MKSAREFCPVLSGVLSALDQLLAFGVLSSFVRGFVRCRKPSRPRMAHLSQPILFRYTRKVPREVCKLGWPVGT
jgi:hypothetical protein